jgi:hypothetical protein
MPPEQERPRAFDAALDVDRLSLAHPRTASLHAFLAWKGAHRNRRNRIGWARQAANTHSKDQEPPNRRFLNEGPLPGVPSSTGNGRNGREAAAHLLGGVNWPRVEGLLRSMSAEKWTYLSRPLT